MSAVAFVPVRGGSRGIPRKNVRSFCGRPLLHWCLRALQQARGIDRVVVATDSDEIAATALKSGCAKVEIYRRSAASATDEASTETVVLEYLARARLPHDAVFVLVQATSPFTRPSDFEGALALLAGAGADAVLSCARSRRFFWDDAGRPINYDPRQRPRRQEFAGWLMENGAFYVSRAGAIQTSRSRLSGRVVPYEMPAHSGLELDDEDDWAAGEALMRRHCLPRRADAGSIRLVLTDVDGVLTDGGMYYGRGGEELKKFNTLDGKAFELLRERGLQTGIVTAERTAIVAARAVKIRADHLRQGAADKLAVVSDLCAEQRIALADVAYVGDDLGDLELLRAVGFAACPATAVSAVKDVVHYVCERKGGEGCVREVADLLLQRAPAIDGRVESHARDCAASPVG